MKDRLPCGWLNLPELLGRYTISGLQFSATDIAVQPVAGSTFSRRRTFDILPYSRHEVFFQENLTAAPQVVPFSITPSGMVSLTSAFTTNSPVSIYVNATGARAFYTVAFLAEPYP